MSRVPAELVEEVRARTDIVEVVSEHVKLRKAGRSFTGLCPFHAEKGASFVVDPQKQLYHCFGCGAGGNVFGFLMALEGLTFPEVLRALATRAGVTLPERRETADRLQPLYDAVREAVRAYRREFLHPERGRLAREYFSKRGFTEKVLESFAVGWAPKRWDFLPGAVRAAGIREGALEQAGLLVPRDSGKGRYDRFRGRVTFPVFTISGAAVGLGGRSLPIDGKEDEPKYLNTPETPIYSKGSLLYGLHRARAAIHREKTAIVVEGYTDVLRLHQEGFDNAVASSGTALTLQQARILVRYSPAVTVLMDADKPGVEAARRAVGELLAAGADVRVVLLPQGHDPDSYLRSEGAESLAQRLEQSQSLLEFEVSLAGAPGDMRADQRLGLARRIAAHLARIPDPLKLDVLARDAAKAVGVGLDALAGEVRRLQRQSGARSEQAAPPTAARGAGKVQAGRPGELDRELVRAVLMSGGARSQLTDELKKGDVADPALALVLSEVLEFAKERPRVPVSEFLARLPEPGIQGLVVALHEDPAPLLEPEQLLAKLLARRAKGCVRELKSRLPTVSPEERPRLLRLIQLNTRLAHALPEDREQLVREIEQLEKPKKARPKK
jgi:DNA primase